MLPTHPQQFPHLSNHPTLPLNCEGVVQNFQASFFIIRHKPRRYLQAFSFSFQRDCTYCFHLLSSISRSSPPLPFSTLTNTQRILPAIRPPSSIRLLGTSSANQADLQHACDLFWPTFALTMPTCRGRLPDELDIQLPHSSLGCYRLRLLTHHTLLRLLFLRLFSNKHSHSDRFLCDTLLRATYQL